MERNHEAESLTELSHSLKSWQILCIVLTAVIGTGIFSSNGEALKSAGPAGLLVAVVIVGVVAIAFMEGLSEMIQVFPTANPIVDYVEEFVDQDLSLCVGIAYWFTYSSIMAVQIATAASFISLWSSNQALILTLQITCFYILAPLFLCALNLRNVNWYGWVESLGGIIKLCIMTVVILALYYLAGKGQMARTNLHEGAASSLPHSHTKGSAICSAIEFIAFSFVGIEAVAVTTWEARELIDLRRPSQIIAYLVFGLYLPCSIGQAMCINWHDSPKLQGITENDSSNPTSTLIVLAAQMVGENVIAHAFGGFLIFSSLSTANTDLYVSSRIMHLIARKYSDRGNRLVEKMSFVDPNTKVPKFCVYFSACAFTIWLPFTQAASDKAAAQNVLGFFFIAGSISALFVWGTLCLSFVRYYYWLEFNREEINTPKYQRLARWNENTRGSHTFLSALQPWLAYLGLAACFIIIFIFSTAIWWGRNPTAAQIVQYYIVPVLLTVIWIAMKTYRFLTGNEWQLWRKINTPNSKDFTDRVMRLEIDLKPSQKRHKAAINAGNGENALSLVHVTAGEQSMSRRSSIFNGTTERSVSSP